MNRYPYTDYQNANLDWIIQKVTQYIKLVDDAITDFNDLKNYVNQFLNENLQPAVDAKLEEWLNDGTLDAIVADVLNDRLPVRSGASNGTIQRIISVAQSYIRHNPDLAYMHRPSESYGYSNGLQADGVFYGWSALEVGENVFSGPSGSNGVQYTDEDGNQKTGKAINCTTYAFLTMLGIPYEASRYVSGIDNDTLNVGKAGYCFNPWHGPVEEGPIPDADGNYHGVGLYDNNQRMVEYFRTAGMLESMASDMSNIYPGDIIFECRSGSGTPYHCGIALHRYETSINNADSEPTILFAECVNSSMPCHFSYLSGNDLTLNGATDGWLLVAHPVYQEVPQTLEDVVLRQDSGFSAMRWDITNLDVLSSDLLTLCMTWTPSSATEQLSVQVATASDALATVVTFPRGRAYNGDFNINAVGTPYDIVIPFIPRTTSQVNGSKKQITKISINITNGSGANNGVITNCRLIKGYPGAGVAIPFLEVSSVADLETQLEALFPVCDNHHALNRYDIIVSPSNDLSIDGNTLSSLYTHPARVYVHTSSGVLSDIRVIFEDLATSELTYNGAWSE